MNDHDKAVLAERVLAGVEYLDETYPGWEESIDLRTFQISSTYGCVLSRIHGRSYWDTPEVDDHELWWSIDHGFYSNSNMREAWDVLQAEWERHIAERISHE